MLPMQRLLFFVCLLASQLDCVRCWVSQTPKNHLRISGSCRLPTVCSAQNPSLPQDSEESILSNKAADSSRRNLLTAAANSAILTSFGLGVAIPVHAYTEDEAKRIAIFEKTSPSVVFIDTFTERRDAFSTNVLEVPLGSGSGFVWDNQGHIVTNFHVVRNAQSAQVAILTKQKPGVTPPPTTSAAASSGSDLNQQVLPYTSMRPVSGASNGMMRSVFKAVVVGVDPGKDIAVLKVDAPKDLLFPVTVGTSTGLKVGQEALAIGNPFGLDHTLTVGVISGVGREVRSPIGRPITNVIQSDAAINPGNSGGPLLDSSGKLIGMNTAIYSPSGASAGIGFAIPVDTVKYIVETLIRDGKVVRPVLGISFLESRQARTLGITRGVLILYVPDGSPAALAGLRGTRRTETGLIEVGDIITKVGDKIIDTESDLFQALENCKPGDTVDVTVNRVVPVNDELQVKEVTVQVKLQESTVAEKNMQIYQYQNQ